MDKKLPLGVRNNNPLNIRPGNPFEGLADPPTNGGFSVFIHNKWGFRAAAKILITYFDKYGLNTVRGIVSRWAPEADNNNVDAYVHSVCLTTGWDADEVIQPKSYNDAWKLLRAMTIVEQGDFEQYFKKWELDDGLRRAGIVDVPATPLRKNVSAVATGVTTVVVAAQPVVDAYQQNKSIFDMLSARSTTVAFITLCLGVLVVGYEILRKNRDQA